jgi:TRAP-type C4-dicarboxylate transport system permease small subunit
VKTSHEGAAYRIDRLFDKVSHVIAYGLISIPAVILVAWILVFIAYITFRYFGMPWVFVEEFTAYFMVLGASFAFAYTLKSGRHIKVDVLIRLLPRLVRNILEVFTLLLGLVVATYLTEKSFEWFLSGVKRGTQSMFPSDIIMWPVYLIVPVGFAAMDLVLLQQLYGSVIRLIKGEVDEDREKGSDIVEVS